MLLLLRIPTAPLEIYQFEVSKGYESFRAQICKTLTSICYRLCQVPLTATIKTSFSRQQGHSFELTHTLKLFLQRVQGQQTCFTSNFHVPLWI